MSTALRIAFFAFAIVGCPLLMLGLLETVDRLDDKTHVWISMALIPAALTTTVGVVARRTATEIALAAILSAALSPLVVLLVILYSISAHGLR